MGEELTVTPEEAGRRLGIGRSAVYGLLASGRLESIRFGRSRRVPVDALRAFVEAERRAQAAAS